MPTAGVINGTNFRLYLGPDPIGHATSCTLSFSKETRETVDKDNVGGWASSEDGKKSFSLSFEGFMSEDPTLNTVAVNNLGDLLTLFNATAAVTWKATTGVLGDTQITGSGTLTEFSLTAPVEENATFSGTITGKGAPVFSTVTV